MKKVEEKKAMDWKKLIGHRLLIEWENCRGKLCIGEIKILEISPLGIIKLDPLTVQAELFSGVWVRQSELAEHTIVEDLGIEKD